MPPAAFDLHITALFRPPNNKFLAKKVLKARRTEGGQLVPSRAGAAWALASVLENDGAVGLLADQAFTKGPRITFMGREVSSNPLGPKLADQFDCDIHPARCIRLPGGRFRIQLFDAIDVARKENGKIDLTGTNQVIADIIEGWVREYPEQWLWLHDRWKIKTIPPRKKIVRVVGRQLAAQTSSIQPASARRRHHSRDRPHDGLSQRTTNDRQIHQP